MAKCPQCKKNWKWDWCADVYVNDEGKTCKFTNVSIPERQGGPAEEAQVYQCDCHQILGMYADSGSVLNCKEWEGIEWIKMEPEHTA